MHCISKMLLSILHVMYIFAGLCWAYGLLLTMIVIVREELYGEYPTKNVTLFAMAYGGYLLMPITIFMRMIQTPLFSKNKTD